MICECKKQFKIGDKVIIKSPPRRLEYYFNPEIQRNGYFQIVPFLNINGEERRFNNNFIGYCGTIHSSYTYPHDFNPQKKLYYDWNVQLFLPYKIIIPVSEEQLEIANVFQIKSSLKRKPKHWYYT